jgi:hypothetical protein
MSVTFENLSWARWPRGEAADAGARSRRDGFRREHARPADGVDVAWLLRTIRSVAPHNVEDGQRIEIARMQQLLAERD